MHQIQELLKFPRLIHAFSTVAEGNMANVILGKVMNSAEVLKNRKDFLQEAGVDIKRVICMWVEHGDKVLKANPKFADISLTDWRYAVHCDAISTDQSNLFLFLLVADCLPVIFFDQKKHSVGLMHYGWKNADLNLAKIMLSHLNKVYGSAPEELIVGFGPAVRKESYIKENPTQVENPVWNGFIEKAGNSYYKVDVPGLCRKQLMKEGVKAGNIIDCGIDTAGDSIFFSRTRALANEKEDLARFACVVGIL